MIKFYITFSPIDLTGGSLLFFLGAYTMMADLKKKTNAKSATVRIAIMDGLIHIGFYVGNAIAGPVKKNLGLKYNFALGALMTIIAAAYTIIFVEETLVREEDRKREGQIEDLIEKDGNFLRDSSV